MCMWQSIHIQDSWWPVHQLEKPLSVWFKSHCLKCFSYMWIPKIWKQIMDLNILVKHFSSFVPNLIFSIKQAFHIIPKAFHIRTRNCGMCPWHFENTTFKNKEREIESLVSTKCTRSCSLHFKFSKCGHPWAIYHGQNLAWWYLSDFFQVKWKDPCTGCWKGPNPVFSIGWRACLCFLTDGSLNTWCGVCSRGMSALMTL